MEDTTNQEASKPKHNPWRTRAPVDIPDHVLDQFNIDNLRARIRETELWEFWHKEEDKYYRGINAKRRLQAILKALLHRENEQAGSEEAPLRGKKYEEVTHEDILKQFDYEPETGKLTHRRLGRVYDLEEPEPFDPTLLTKPNIKPKTTHLPKVEWDGEELVAVEEIHDSEITSPYNDYVTSDFDQESDNTEYRETSDLVTPIDEDEIWDNHFTELVFDPANQHRIKVKGHLFPATQIIWMWKTGNWGKAVVTFVQGCSYTWDNLITMTRSEARRREAYYRYSGARRIVDSLYAGADLFLRIDYNPVTGKFKYKDTRAYRYSAKSTKHGRREEKLLVLKEGQDATMPSPHGHRNVLLARNKFFYADVVAWLLYYGEVNIDLERINGDVGDNRIENLRCKVMGKTGSLDDPRYEPKEWDLEGTPPESDRFLVADYFPGMSCSDKHIPVAE